MLLNCDFAVIFWYLWKKKKKNKYLSIYYVCSYSFCAKVKVLSHPITYYLLLRIQMSVHQIKYEMKEYKRERRENRKQEIRKIPQYDQINKLMASKLWNFFFVLRLIFSCICTFIHTVCEVMWCEQHTKNKKERNKNKSNKIIRIILTKYVRIIIIGTRNTTLKKDRYGI